jgi:hypothetical protein
MEGIIMKRHSHWYLLFVGALMLLLAVGCFENSPTDEEGDGGDVVTDPEAVERLVATADSMVTDMIGVDSEGPEDLSALQTQMAEIEAVYKEAAAADPTDGRANFGAALFGFQSVINDPELTEITDMLDEWTEKTDDLDHARWYLTEIFMNGENDFLIREDFGWSRNEFVDPLEAMFTLMYFFEQSTANTELIAWGQELMDTVVLTELDEAITYMERVLGDDDFTYEITQEMTGDDESFEIDLGEAYMIAGTMRLFRSVFTMLTAYDMNIPGARLSDYSDSSVMFALLEKQDTTSGPFLKLRDMNRLPRARQEMLKALDHVDDAVAFISAETDDQLDDIIKREDVTEADDEIDSSFGDFGDDNPLPLFRGTAGILDLTDRIRTMLSGPFDIEIEMEGGTETISIDLSAFLNNAIADVKTFLPYHTWVVDQPSEREYSGPAIESWIDNLEGPDEYNAYNIRLFDFYRQAIQVDDLQLYYFLTGTHTTDGVLTVDGGFDGIQIVPLSPGALISTNGEMYLDSQGRFSMTAEAYATLDAFVADSDRDEWQAFELFNFAGGMYSNNFSVDHPFGVRGPDGVFKFAGSNNYRYNNGPMRLLVGPGGAPIEKDDFPVFPDPTLGGVLPGMTQARLESFAE